MTDWSLTAYSSFNYYTITTTFGCCLTDLFSQRLLSVRSGPQRTFEDADVRPDALPVKALRQKVQILHRQLYVCIIFHRSSAIPVARMIKPLTTAHLIN